MSANVQYVVVAVLVLTALCWAGYVYHRIFAPTKPQAPPNTPQEPELNPVVADKLNKAEEFYAKKDVAITEKHDDDIKVREVTLEDTAKKLETDVQGTNDYLLQVGKDVRSGS